MVLAADLQCSQVRLPLATAIALSAWRAWKVSSFHTSMRGHAGVLAPTQMPHLSKLKPELATRRSQVNYIRLKREAAAAVAAEEQAKIAAGASSTLVAALAAA